MDTNIKPNHGYHIVNMGDSIWGNYKGDTSISAYLSQITGAKTYNCGFGGCQMSATKPSAWRMFCMCELADAISSGDYDVQQKGAIAGTIGMPNYFSDTVKMLQNIDFFKIDIMTIAYGTNDFTAGVKLENEQDKYDKMSFCGSMRYSIETILKAYPNIRLVIVAPSWRFWYDQNEEFCEIDSDELEIEGNYLTDFVDKCKQIGKEYHIPVVDPYYELSINKFNYKQWFGEKDGTHPNATGRKYLAKLVAKTITAM